MPSSRPVLTPTLAAMLAGLVAASPAASSAAVAPVSVDAACATSPDAAFPDTATQSAALRDAIGCLGAHDIAAGYADKTFRPFASITRGEMALFLLRELDWMSSTNLGLVTRRDDPDGQVFADLDGVGAEMAAAIKALATLGVVQGRTATTFSPHAPVTRRDMASMIVRSQQFIADSLDDDSGYGATPGVVTFPDVPADLARAGDVEALVAAGIAAGGTDGLFRPFDPVSRGEMALFVARHLAENVAGGRALPAEPAAGVVRNISTVERFSDLSDAVAAAAPGATLTLQGTLTETGAPVLINKSLNLTGYDYKHVADFGVRVSVRGSLLVSGADNVIITGIDFDAPVAHAGQLSAVYLNDTADTMLFQVSMAGAGSAVRTTGTVVADLTQSGVYVAGTGVVVAQDGQMGLSRNVIQGAATGVELAGSSAARSAIVDNAFEDNDIHVADTATVPYDLGAVLAANRFVPDAAVVGRTIVDASP